MEEAIHPVGHAAAAHWKGQISGPSVTVSVGGIQDNADGTDGIPNEIV
jgi:hypothetical protein